jgi:DNA-binding CsgD family transcriptional regulator
MDELHRLILNVYQAAQNSSIDEFHEIVLGSVKKILPFDSCRWGVALTRTDESLQFHRVHLHNEDPESMTGYAELSAKDLMGLRAATHPGKTINFQAKDTYSRRPGYSEFLHYLRRYRHENLLLIGSVSSSKGIKSLSFYRGDEHNHFTESERQICEALFPHMMEALSINLKLSLAAVKSNDGPTRWPMVMCDPNGFIVYAEPEFLSLIQEEWPGSPCHRLPASLVTSLLDQKQRHLLGASIFAACMQRDDTRIYIKARRRLAVDALSKREIEVAKEIANGLSFKEIARALNLSPATVRNHTQRIHERLEIRSNTELAAQIGIAYPWCR